jgi:hypothetical protein
LNKLCILLKIAKKIVRLKKLIKVISLIQIDKKN